VAYTSDLVNADSSSILQVFQLERSF